MAAKTPRWAGALGLTETPDSGALTLGERTMLKRVFEGTYGICRAALAPRGTFGTGSMSGWVLTSCDLASLRGAKGRITFSWEPGGAHATMPLPCDDFSSETVELYPRTERNAIYNQTSTGTGTKADLTLATIGLVYSAVHAATAAARAGAAQQVSSLSNADQASMGLSLLDKLRKGEETYYLAGVKHVWWSFGYVLPVMTLGAFIQFPTGPGLVPTAYPATMSFLRLADVIAPVGVNGSMFKRTRTWIGGPKGHWDTDLYPP